MTKQQALSWLSQPGIKATLYHYDKHTNEALRVAIEALSEPEIIYCRDCKNLEIDKIYHDCWCDGKKVFFDHYCGYAERRTDVDVIT